MKHSNDRILTTHAGRLEGPPDYSELLMAVMSGKRPDMPAIQEKTPGAILEAIRRQSDAGIDIISDGELSKIGFGGIDYYGRRLSGLSNRKLKPGEPPMMAMETGERIEFAAFYREMRFLPMPEERTVCSGPISYIGQEVVKQELDMVRALLAESGAHPEETFLCVLSPGWLEHFFLNEHYATEEEYVFALADAMKSEYKAVVDAGFILQIDDPALPDTFDMIVPNPSIEEYRKFAEVRIEALNSALKELPEDRVRYHICWGSWHGPHTHDLPLHHVIDLMLKIHAGAYSVEAANPRHEHEWKLWQSVKLPEGKILIPGVVTHHTNVVEHPELVADRIIRYANVVGRENVIAGTDCGMGYRVHPQIAWAKLKALAEGAALASQQLWGARTSATR